MRAYALMRQSEELEAVFAASPLYGRARIELEAIRAGLPGTLPLSYRGIERYPFTEYAEKGPGWLGETVPDPEPQARALMLKLLGPDDDLAPYPRAFLGQLEHATSVHAALSAAQLYEIVELCTAPEYPGDLLGFDVGYWGGGNFSTLCDAAIWPLWHPPDPAVLSDLSLALSELNEHGLFPTEHSARAYFDWYTKQPWAEKEPSDFSIIAVGALKPVVG
jgi:hypothetical protein